MAYLYIIKETNKHSSLSNFSIMQLFINDHAERTSRLVNEGNVSEILGISAEEFSDLVSYLGFLDAANSLAYGFSFEYEAMYETEN